MMLSGQEKLKSCFWFSLNLLANFVVVWRIKTQVYVCLGRCPPSFEFSFSRSLINIIIIPLVVFFAYAICQIFALLLLLPSRLFLKKVPCFWWESFCYYTTSHIFLANNSLLQLSKVNSCKTSDWNIEDVTVKFENTRQVVNIFSRSLIIEILIFHRFGRGFVKTRLTMNDRKHIDQSTLLHLVKKVQNAKVRLAENSVEYFNLLIENCWLSLSKNSFVPSRWLPMYAQPTVSEPVFVFCKVLVVMS